MNKDVIPFIPRNFGSFIGLLIIFIALGVIINNVHLSWCSEVLMYLIGEKRWYRNIRGPRLWCDSSYEESLIRGDDTYERHCIIENTKLRREEEEVREPRLLIYLH